VPGEASAGPVTPQEVQQQMATGAGNQPTQPDALGDFIKQNDQLRAMANTPAAPASTGLSRIGGGISDLAQGNFQQGWESVKGGVGDLYNKISPSAIQQQGAVDAVKTVQQQFPGVTQDQILNAPSGSVLANAYKAAMPGMFATYGPIAGAGLGIAALTGGFSPQALPSSQMAEKLAGNPGEDLIRANPGKYLTQNLPGVQYDPTGNITGSTPWRPAGTMGDVQRATAGIGLPQLGGPIYQPPMGGLGGGAPVYQPYNSAAAYGNLMPPRFFSQGGMGLASLAQGGYPRRTGQISGPGTETSDSIPAMLSDGEFVMTAQAVRGAGKGSRREGAKKMYALMHQLERNASRG